MDSSNKQKENFLVVENTAETTLFTKGGKPGNYLGKTDPLWIGKHRIKGIKHIFSIEDVNSTRKTELMKKLLTMLAAAGISASVYAAICPVCDGPMGAGKKMCNKCQEETDRHNAAVSSALLQGFAQTQKKQQAVNKAVAKLSVILPDKKISNSEKIKAVNSLLKQVNAPEFYQVVASYAPLSVIKYYWPDRRNDKVYLLSKKVIEKEQNKSLSEMYQQGLQMQGSIMGVAKMDAPKKSRTAFALGRTKKDGSIRFVDPLIFSYSILKAVVNNPDTKVLEYFLDQIDGWDWEIRQRCMEEIMWSHIQRVSEKKKLTEELAKAEKDLKNADDKFEKKEYSNRIADLKNEIAGIPDKIVIDDAKAKLIFKSATRFELFACWWDADRSPSLDIDAAKKAFKDFLNLAMKFCSPQVAAWIKTSTLGENWKHPMFKDRFLKDKKIFGDEINDRITSLKPRAIKEIPCYVYVEYGDWGSIRQGVRWRYGIPDPSRPGYVSDEKKGTFVWKRGVPDVHRLGFISGEKEGEWVAAPGFRKNGNQMIWVPGSAHPSVKGLVAGKTPCSWIPDEKHLWKNPDNPGDISVRKDCNVFLDFLNDTNSNRRYR